MASTIVEVLRVILRFLSKPVAVVVVAALTALAGVAVVLAPQFGLPMLVVEVAQAIAGGGLVANMFQTAAGAKAREEQRELLRAEGDTLRAPSPSAPPLVR